MLKAIEPADAAIVPVREPDRIAAHQPHEDHRDTETNQKATGRGHGEIIGMLPIRSIPQAPPYVRGVINLRGRTIPVIDLRLRFGIEEIDYTERTCIIVVNIDDKAIGMVVDKVNEVADIPESQIEPPPKAGQSDSNFIECL